MREKMRGSFPKPGGLRQIPDQRLRILRIDPNIPLPRGAPCLRLGTDFCRSTSLQGNLYFHPEKRDISWTSAEEDRVGQGLTNSNYNMFSGNVILRGKRLHSAGMPLKEPRCPKGRATTSCDEKQLGGEQPSLTMRMPVNPSGLASQN